MKSLILAFMSFWLCAANSVSKYKYLGIVGSIVVLHDSTKSIFVRVGDFIPFTDIRVTNVSKLGANTTQGLIGFEYVKTDTYVVDYNFKFGEGDCFLINGRMEHVRYRALRIMDDNTLHPIYVIYNTILGIGTVSASKVDNYPLCRSSK